MHCSMLQGAAQQSKALELATHTSRTGIQLFCTLDCSMRALCVGLLPTSVSLQSHTTYGYHFALLCARA